jgi:V/A-type H+-transporting ATPase subunit E
MDKLQELTERLYNEGLSKGKEEGKAIVAEAEAKAAEILDSARKEAEAIVEKARKEADDFTAKTRSDVRMASRETLQSLRSDVENLVVASMVSEPVGKALSEEGFIKDVIRAVAEKFSADEPQDLSIVLPESLRGAVGDFVCSELPLILGKGVDATFSKKIAGGFRIAPKDGSYFISMTDETFRDLVGAFLRPATKELLFGSGE